MTAKPAILAAIAVATLGACVTMEPQQGATDPVPIRKAARTPAAPTAMAAPASTPGGYVDPAASNQMGAKCQAYFEARQYGQLFPCLDQLEALRIPPTAREYYLRPETISRAFRAEALIDFGDYLRAIESARAGYELAQPLPRGPGKSVAEIQNLTALTLAQVLSGDRAGAESSFAKLEELFNYYNRPGVKGKGGTTAMSQFSAGRAYFAMGRYERAIAAVEKDKTSLFDKPNVMQRQQFIKAKSLLELGRLDEAKAIYDQLLAAPAFQEVASLYWLALYDAGRIEERAGRLDRAIDYYRRAIDVIEQQRSTINTEASKIGFAGNRQAVYGRLVASLYATGRQGAAFDVVERAKARALVDMLAAKQDFAVAGANADQVKTLLAEARSSEQVALEAGGNRISTRAAVLDVRQRLREQSPELASLLNVNTLAAGEVQAGLAPEDALVEYYFEGGELYAFVLTRDDLRAARLDGASLVADVQAFRSALEDPYSPAYQAPARKLYDVLVRPLESNLRPKLTVVAHGPLHYLPFAALHDGKRFLLEAYSLRLLPSASVVKFIRGRAAAKPGGVLAFGNPDLGDAKWDLQFAEAEARVIAGTVPQSRALLRKEATEAALRQYGAGFSYLHFATHGVFNPEAPLRSALMLARGEDSDGRLTVDKLYSMRLDADLVTLSACKTGLGRTAGGDDVLGFTRGFLYAGARSIVSSLWEVDDQPTALIMTKFYGNLKTMDKRESLRAAQLATMKRFPEPFFWAAFQLIGSTD